MAKANILLVEDSNTQGAKTKAFLEKRNYAVTWVLYGMSVFRMVKTRPFDVILLDHILPDMDGTRVCTWLKQNEDTKGIPIIMLTAKNTTTDKVHGPEFLADDYLAKPYEEAELNIRIYAALRTKTLRDELNKANHELKKMFVKVDMLSVRDPLTGLFNRRRFEEVLASECRRSNRTKTALSCMMIDIDNFKAVNDTHGHGVGDTVIKDMSMIILQNIRDFDTACRWGGEEFVVLLPMTSKVDALKPARRILKSVSDHSFSGVGDKKITVSIGVADLTGTSIDSANHIVLAADKALYDAKKKGMNRIETA